MKLWMLFMHLLYQDSHKYIILVKYVISSNILMH